MMEVVVVVVRSRELHQALDARLEQAAQHDVGASVLEALVSGQAVFCTVAAAAKLARVQRVGLLVAVLEVSLQGVVTTEHSSTVWALLGLVHIVGRGRHLIRNHLSCKK
jgi:Na+/H+ antiporter NhaB